MPFKVYPVLPLGSPNEVTAQVKNYIKINRRGKMGCLETGSLAFSFYSISLDLKSSYAIRAL